MFYLFSKSFTLLPLAKLLSNADPRRRWLRESRQTGRNIYYHKNNSVKPPLLTGGQNSGGTRLAVPVHVEAHPAGSGQELGPFLLPVPWHLTSSWPGFNTP